MLALRTKPAQKRYVATAAYSHREAERHPNELPWLRAISAGERPVGFAMVACDLVPEPPAHRRSVLPLAAAHRPRASAHGLRPTGRRTGHRLIRADGGTELITSCVEGEGNPLGFSTRLGFVPRGDLDPEGDTMVRRLPEARTGPPSLRSSVRADQGRHRPSGRWLQNGTGRTGSLAPRARGS